jgi:hypothetical protein
MQLMILIAGVAFLTGVVCTALLVLRVGSNHEGRAAAMADEPPSRVAAAARRMTGLYARGPEVTPAWDDKADGE